MYIFLIIPTLSLRTFYFRCKRNYFQKTNLRNCSLLFFFPPNLRYPTWFFPIPYTFSSSGKHVLPIDWTFNWTFCSTRWVRPPINPTNDETNVFAQSVSDERYWSLSDTNYGQLWYPCSWNSRSFSKLFHGQFFFFLMKTPIFEPGFWERKIIRSDDYTWR